MKINQLIEKTGAVTIEQNELLISGIRTEDLLEMYGSPLYVYCEDVIRDHCRRLKNAVSYPHFSINYSMKANSTIALLKIIREEGLSVDVMSPGEIYCATLAGFKKEEIFFVSNNVDLQEFAYAKEHDIRISVDSLSQLEMFGKAFSGSKVAVRINPGIGDGHHKKVITGGDATKFGIHVSHLDSIKEIAKKYDLHIHGLNMHIGSNFLEYGSYMAAGKVLCDIAKNFDSLEFIDIGGGLGVNYKEGNKGLDIEGLGSNMDRLFNQFAIEYGKEIKFFIEPGRFIVAESGLLLTRVCSRKENPNRTYIGCDSGFNVLMRPMAYGSYHEIVHCQSVEGERETLSVVGNICETGDILAENRALPKVNVDNVLAILDAGAYGYSMASNYNSRLRPAELLVTSAGERQIIRKRDELTDLISSQLVNNEPVG